MLESLVLDCLKKVSPGLPVENAKHPVYSKRRRRRRRIKRGKERRRWKRKERRRERRKLLRNFCVFGKDRDTGLFLSEVRPKPGPRIKG